MPDVCEGGQLVPLKLMTGHAGMGWGAGAHKGASSGATAACGAVAGACCMAVLVECMNGQGIL